ncbi:TRAP transporter substrate-binding protein [Muricoccus pecuniae]|uniref:TRAP-type mannitol/chloroaromatic compound transport system substrate-binding protein n=1 Tax=Muricoccus pecuniae TaxID=693023 RepID=A0A840Y1Y0_9PROT|nr:TRAP transporter substrate-binding protein DctP [Roseomonas pecuniae]MBB5695118.1 TRAP-type mannitol/chloroaromatic compound transport system substrate-binding protein [Roseomonas pecuniae]
MVSRVNRRALLTAAPAAAVPVALAAPAIAQTNPEVRWRLTSSFPRNTDILWGTAEAVARRVGELTEGRFRIQAFPGGEIAPALAALDAVQSGSIECAHTASYYYIGKDPALAFFTAVPFGLNTRQNTAWLRHGGGQDLMNEMMREYNAVAFPCGDTGAQMGGWFRREIRTVDDVKGLKFRITGLAGQVFQRMGATASVVPASDIYSSLERGTIDAAEFVGPHDDEKLGFARVAPNYYAPGFWEPGARLHFIANQRAYDALPAPYKAAIAVATAEADAEMVAKYDVANPQALRRLVAGGAQLRFWSRPILEAAWRATNEVMDELAGKNERFKRIMESHRRFRDDVYTWHRVSENSFDNFAFTAAQTVR